MDTNVEEGTASENQTGVSEDSKLWGKAQYEKLLNLMEEQVHLGNGTGKGSFNKIGWENIVNSLQASFGKDYVIKKVRGKWNRERPIWRKFKRVKEHTGVGFNPTTGLVTMPLELWETMDKEITGSKAKFMGKPFVYHRQWSVIDAYGEATGEHAIPSTQIPESFPESSTRPVPVVIGDDDIDFDELMGSPGPKRKKKREEGLMKAMYDFMRVIEKTSERRDDKFEKSSQSVVSAFKEASSKSTPRMESPESRSDEATSPSKKPYDEFLVCIEILDTIEGIDSVHYSRAVMALEKSVALRKFFLKVSDDRKRDWAMGLS